MRCASTSPPTGCITRGLMVKSLFTKILGSRFKRELKRVRAVVDGILRHEERLKALSDAERQAQTPKLRAAIAERTSALVAEVERLKREKHDCPDAGQRAALSDQLARAEAAYGKELQAALDDVPPEALPILPGPHRRPV